MDLVKEPPRGDVAREPVSPPAGRRPQTGPLPNYEIQYRTIHGYRRAFVHAGNGPALLLIHGIGDCCGTWRDLIPELARDYTVVAPDLLGHGRSDKPRADYSVAAYANGMRDLLTVLGVDRATIVGHSLGGGVALQFSYQYPERCERLVLVSTGGVGPDVHPVLRLASAPSAALLLLPLLGLPGVRAAGRLLLNALSLLGTDIGVDARHFERVFDSLPDRRARRAFMRTLQSVVDWRGQAITMLDRCYLGQDLPTLFVWGSRDAVIPLHHAQTAHEMMAHSRLEIFVGSGHFPHQDDPERFRAVLSDFLATTAPPSFSPELFRERLRSGRPQSVRSTSTAPGLVAETALARSALG